MNQVEQPNKSHLIKRLDEIIKELLALRAEWSRELAEAHSEPVVVAPPMEEPVEQVVEEFFAPVDELSLEELFVDAVAESEAYNQQLEVDEEEELSEEPSPLQPLGSQALRFTLIERLSLLDNYHFAQGLFAGNQAELRNVLYELEKMSSLPQAEDYVTNRLGIDIGSEVGEEFWAFIEQNSRPA